ncbi:hypothetical protein, partial [Dyella jejuensis]|uniref:hypothetical protein n=1 Tax=Dyella jejuensis TaxID=1432009 RepID=UPI0038511311
GTPASPCLRIETICASLNFDFFMEPPGGKDARKFYFLYVQELGELTQAQRGLRNLIPTTDRQN